MVLNLVLNGVNELCCPKGFQIGVILDALLTSIKSDDLREHLEEV